MSNRRALVGLACLFAASACSEDPQTILDAGGPPTGTADAGQFARGVVIETLRLDFGAVVATSTDTASFTLTNENPDPVKVTVTEPMGGDSARFSRSFDVSDESGRFEIEGGGVVTVTVRVSPSDLGVIGTNLLVESCLGECPVLVEVRAEGVESGVACETPVDVGLVFPGTCAQRTVTCTNRSNADEEVGAVELLEGSDSAFEITAPTLPTTLAPGEVLTVDFEFCPSAATAAEARVRVATIAPFPTEQVIELLGRGGGPRISCGPEAIAFGRVGLGGAGRAAYTCYNDGFDPAGIELRLTAGTDFGLGTMTASIAAGSFQVIEVTATPGAEGAVQDTLTVTTNDGATPTLTVPLTAEGVVIGPCTIEGSPTILDFGIVAAGDRHAAPVRVRNTGGNDCLIGEAFASMGADSFGARGLPPRGSVLAPGESLVFEVTFTPRISAILQGEVTLTLANPGAGRLTFEVRGQGGPAGVVPEPVAVDFGAVPTTCAAPITRTVTLRRLSPTATGVTNVVVDSEVDGVFELLTPVGPTNLDFFGTVSFEVGFMPTTEGLYAGQVRVFFGLPTPVVIPLLGEARAGNSRVQTVTVASPKVDLLFVVDDSGGNDAVQAGLVAAIPAFAARLQDRQADFHFGVVTTDMTAPNRTGRLIGNPSFLDQNTPSLATAMAERVQPGTDGAGVEQGLAASLAALTSPLREQDNLGFRRADADLVVVYISSEDDQSPNGVSTQLALETLRGASRGRRLLVAGLVGPPTGDCDGPAGSAVTAERYATLIGRHDDGLLLSYCADVGANLDALADRVLGADINLTGTPVIDQIVVRVGGTDLPRTNGATRNWGYDLAANAIVFFGAPISNGDTIEVSYPLLCVPGTCGDMQTDAGEYCDDGNADSADACIECRNATCGDGITWTGTEDCDDGNLSDVDACLTTCVAARCGDGIVQAGVEICDDGNTVGGDGCPATCRFYQSSGLQPHSFEELANGSPLVFSDPDDGRTSVTLPFSFEFDGVATSSLAVSVNGFASVLSIDSATSFDNVAIPDAAAPNGLLAPWWDDLVIDPAIDGGAATSTAVLGDAPNRQYVIEWRDVRAASHSTNGHRRWTFQLVLEETSHRVIFRYADTETQGRVPSAVTASSGLEDGTGSLGIEALGCSPGCSGPARAGNRPAGFPEQSEVILTP